MRRLVVAAGAAALLVALALGLLERTRRQWDLTSNQSLSLSSTSKDVVRSLHRRVQITAFLDRSIPGRAESAALLERYRRLNPRISYRLRDPAGAAALAQRLGIDPVFGGIALQSGDRIERAPTVTEQDITAGLARIVRNNHALVCLTSGHGEPDPAATTPNGIADAVALLRSNGYRMKTADLLTSTVVPAECRAVVVTNPTAPLGDKAVAALARFLENDGRALVLSDPESTADPTPVTKPWGIGFVRGIVAEGDDDHHLPGDPLSVVVTKYGSASPVVTRLAPTLFPGAEGLDAAETSASGRTVALLARSTAASFLEKDPVAFHFDDGTDVPGPITIVAAVDQSRVQAGRVHRTRLVAAGEADWMTNAFVGQAGNGRLLVQSLDWLTLDEDLVSVSANIPPYRPLPLTDRRRSYALFMAVGVMPLALLLVFGSIWAVRRGR